MSTIGANLRYPTIPLPEASLVPLGEFATMPTIRIRRTVTLIGDSPEALVRLRSRSISPRHAVIFRSNQGIVIRDLASESGIIVNDARVSQAILSNHDRLRIGKIEFRVEVEELVGVPNANTSPPAVIRLQSGIARAIKQPLFVIGTQADCQLILPSSGIAESHAAIFDIGKSWFVVHLAEDGETKVNGAVTEIAELQAGDAIEIAGHVFDFEVVPEEKDIGVGASGELPGRPNPALPGTPSSTADASRQAAQRAPIATQRNHIPEWVSDAGDIAFAVARSALPFTDLESVEPPTPPIRRGSRRWIGVAATFAALAAAAVLTWYAYFRI